MSLFKRLRLVFTYGPEIEEILEDKRKEAEFREHEAKQHRLALCEKHQPYSPGTIYAEHNCDHCRLLKSPNIRDLK